MLFAEVSKFTSSLYLALEINFYNKVERLVYVEKYQLTYCIILDNTTCQGLLNYSFLLNDAQGATNLCYCNCFLIFLQFKGIEFISCIQEKYKLPARLNPLFNSFHGLKFHEPSSNLLRKLTFL